MTTPVITDTGRAAAILRAGGIVAIPTETVYGLAAVATDTAAVRRVFAAKGRPADHPLIVHVSDTAMASRYGLMTDDALALAGAHWPGPLTLLLERTPLVDDVVTGGRDTVAVRVPDHPMALEVIRSLGEGLVAPSANRFGHVSPTGAAHVLDDLDGMIDAVLDGGSCRVGVESTIVDCTAELQVLRPGAVTAEDVFAATGKRPVTAHGESRAPGMLASHYAPRARVILVNDPNDVEGAANGRKTTVIGSGIPDDEYAARLYSLMREADDLGSEVIVAILPAGEGIAAAIRDRLRKAAADTRG